MNTGDRVLTLSIYELLLFKPSKEGDIAILWFVVIARLRSCEADGEAFFDGVRKRVGSTPSAFALCWRLLLCWGSTEGGACLQMIPVLEVEKSIFLLLVKMKLFASGEGRERLFFLSLSLLPGHHFFSSAPCSVTDTISTKFLWQPFSHPVPGLLWQDVDAMQLEMFRNWESLLEELLWCEETKGREGRSHWLFFFPLRNWNECLWRHNLQEQKLWVRNVERSLMEGGGAFCAVSLNSDHLIFCLCSAQNERKENIRTSDLQLLIVCLLLMSRTFWRGLWLVCGKGIYRLISGAQMHKLSLSHKHLHSWYENKSSLD